MTGPSPSCRLADPTSMDSTKLRSWMSCRRRFYYGYMLALEPTGRAAPEADQADSESAESVDAGFSILSKDLAFGLAVHDGLESLESALAAGADRAETLATVLETLMPPAAVWDLHWQDSKKNRESLARTLIWYAETFWPQGGRPSVWPLAAEIPFRVDLGQMADLGLLPALPSALRKIRISGRLDGLVEGPEADSKWVRERKTTSQALSSWYLARYSPDLQISIYDWLAPLLDWQVLGLEVSAIQGVLLEAIQVGAGFVRFLRQPIRRSLGQSQETAQSVVQALTEMDSTAVFSGNMDIGRFPKNESACMSGGIPCAFRAVCNASPGRDRDAVLDFGFRPRQNPWNPLDGAGRAVLGLRQDIASLPEPFPTI